MRVLRPSKFGHGHWAARALDLDILDAVNAFE